MLQQFERDPHFRVDDHYDLTKDEQRKRAMTRVLFLYKVGWCS